MTRSPTRTGLDVLIAVLLFVVGGAWCVAMGAYLSLDDGGPMRVIAYAVTLFLPTLFAIWHALRRRTAFSYGLAAGMAVTGLMPWVLLRSIAAIGGSGSQDFAGQVAVLALPIVALHAGLLFAAVIAARRASVGLGIGGVLRGSVVAAFLFIACGTLADSAAWLVDGTEMESLVDDRRRLVLAETKIQSCALRWRDAHPDDGFPATIDSIGPRGSGCLTAEEARGTRGLSIHYEGTAPDLAGRSMDFLVSGAFRNRGRSVGLAGDASGLLRSWTRGGGSVGWGSPEYSVIRSLASLRNCAVLARSDDPAASLPASINEIGATARGRTVPEYVGCSAPELAMAKADAGPPPGDGGVESRIAGYRYSFLTVHDADGQVTDFRLEARPRVHGETGIRSYVVGATGPVHFTLADRAATLADSALLSCPFADRRGSTPCATLIGPGRPMVALQHDPVADPQRRFTIRVVGAGDSTRVLPAGLRYHIQCELLARRDAPAPTGPPLPNPDQELELVPIRVCEPFDSLFNQRSDTLMLATAWVRDSTGASWFGVDTVPLVRPPTADRKYGTRAAGRVAAPPRP